MQKSVQATVRYAEGLDMDNHVATRTLSDSEASNLSVVQRLFNEVWNDRQADTAADLLSPELVLQYDHGELKGISGWKDGFYRPLIEALPDVRIEIEDIVASGDRVVARWRARATFKGALFGVHPTGEVVTFRGVSWMRLLEGRIVEMWTHWDVSYLIRRLLSEVNQLRGIIPICMHCKEIRDDKGYWNRLEKYITERSDVQFSHSICDKCLRKLYPGKSPE